MNKKVYAASQRQNSWHSRSFPSSPRSQMPINNQRRKLVMANKNLIRAVVLAALCAWPGVEMYRLYAAKQDLASRLQVESKVTLRLAMTRQKTQLAQTPAAKH